MRAASGPPHKIPRRVVLTGTGAVLAAGAILLGAGPAETPLPERPVTLRDRWIEAITARSRMLHPTAQVTSQLRALDNSVRAYLDDAAEADGGAVFASLPFDGEDSSALSVTATRLATMSKAWLTPGSAFVRHDRVRRGILDGVERLLDAGYHEGAEAYGNWWDWEIGTARPLADVLCLFRDELPGQILDDAATAMRYFVPDPTYSRLMNYATTASNRVNTVRGALIAAVATEDDDRIRECVEALPEAWRIVDRLDGFYEDGGFIQHLDVAYTGNYGTDLLRNLAPVLLMLDGTEYDVERKDELWELVDSAFLPVMVNGHVLDAVRGRAVARLSSNGSVVGQGAAGAIAQMARIASEPKRTSWTDLLRKWSANNPTVDLLEGADVPTAVALQTAAGLPYEDVEEPPGRYFASMDRLVHRTAAWTLAVSMSSNRIAAYEGTESENASGVLTGNSMRYVFLDDDPAPFDDHFWATLDYSKPPGTTNHRIAFTPVPTRGSSDNVPRNEWTGGFVHGSLGVAAMHQITRDDEAPECRRLTVAGEEWIVELVSDIRTELEAYTTVENRLLPDGSSTTLTVDGAQVEEPGSHEGATWAHVAEVGGFLFPGGAQLDAGVRRRVGSTHRVEQEVEAISRSARVTREWATLDLRHGDEAAWWVLLPGAELEDSRTAAAELEDGTFPARAVRNDASAQVVSIDGSTLVAAVWTSTVLKLARNIEVRCKHPVLLLAERTDDGVVLRLTDPTQDQARTEVTVSGRWSLASADEIDAEDLAVRVEGDSSRVTASSRGRGGASFVVRLLPD